MLGLYIEDSSKLRDIKKSEQYKSKMSHPSGTMLCT